MTEWQKKWTEIGTKYKGANRLEEFKKYCMPFGSVDLVWLNKFKEAYRDWKNGYTTAKEAIFSFNKFYQYYTLNEKWFEPYDYEPSKIAEEFVENFLNEWKDLDDYEQNYVEMAVDFGVSKAPGIRFTKKELKLLEKLLSSYENYSDNSSEKRLLNKIRGKLNGRK